MRFYGICLAAAVSIGLSACGGGGGADQSAVDPVDISGGPQVVGSLSSSIPGLQLSSLAIDMSTEQGDDRTQVAVDGVVNQATGPVYVFVTHTNNGLAGVSFEQRSATGGRLLLSALRSIPGVYRDDIRVDVCYDQSCSQPVLGSPQTIKVSYTVLPARPPAAILPSQYGVALAKLPFGQRLSQDVEIEQTSQAIGGWTAQADVPWLQVTPEGGSGVKLRITADPSGLPEGFNGAVVTVMSAVDKSARAAQIRVGLYIGSKRSAPEFDQAPGEQVQIDPSRPLVYSIKDSKVLIDHLHTGRRLLAAGIPGVRFGEIALSPDGSRLVLIDADLPRVWLFNTDNSQFLGFYDLPVAQAFSSPETRRTPVIFKANGRDILTVLGLSTSAGIGGYYMMDLNTGMGLTERFSLAFWEYDTVHVAPDSRHLAVHTNLSPNSMRWAQMTENSKGRIFYTGISGGTLSGQLYLNTPFFVSTSGQETISCQGIVSPRVNWSDAVIDSSLIENFIWATPVPNYGDELRLKQCTDITPFGGGDQFLMIKDDAQEIQARTRSGALIGSWMADQPLSGRLKSSSDRMRVFGSRGVTLVDLPLD